MKRTVMAPQKGFSDDNGYGDDKPLRVLDSEEGDKGEEVTWQDNPMVSPPDKEPRDRDHQYCHGDLQDYQEDHHPFRVWIWEQELLLR